MIAYTIRYNREAISAIYQITRGTAGEVTLAIKTLSQEPRPFDSFATDLPNTYATKVAGYFVTYEVVELERYVIILAIEKAQSES